MVAVGGMTTSPLRQIHIEPNEHPITAEIGKSVHPDFDHDRRTRTLVTG